MIFENQKLNILKHLQAQNQLIQNISNQIIKRSNLNNSSLNHMIQSIAIKWMETFVGLVQMWISQTSNKYILKFNQIVKTSSNNQITKTSSNSQINKASSNNLITKTSSNNKKVSQDQYLTNLSLYVQSMEQPFSKSLSNLQSLYLKYPSDESIEQPKNYLNGLYSNSVYFTKTINNQKIEQTKKKSFSIESQNRSRSKSRNRKLSFFTNNTKQKANIFDMFSKGFKNNSNLNTTVKKTKKTINFIKNQQSNSQLKENINRSLVIQPQSSITKNTKFLKAKLQQRLVNTCSSNFFNILNKETQKPQISKPHQDQQLMKEDLKRKILIEIEQTDKQKYSHLVSDIQHKITNKLQTFMNQFLQKTKHNSTKQKQLLIQPQQEKLLQARQQQIRNKFQKAKPSQQNSSVKFLQSPSILTSKLVKNEYKQNTTLTKESFEQKQSKTNSSVIVKDTNIPKQSFEQKQKQNKINSSVIAKDTNSIIRSKKKLSETPKINDRPSISKSFQKNQYQLLKQPKIIKNTRTNFIQQNDNSLSDSMEIIDQRDIIKLSKDKGNKIVQKAQIIQANAKKPKNVGEIKTSMQKSFKMFTQICKQLTLPVNQSFLVLFVCKYKDFCLKTRLKCFSQQSIDFLSNYQSDQKLKSKYPSDVKKFLIDALIKMQKMLKLNCPNQKKNKIKQFVQTCITCINNIVLETENHQQIKQKIQQINKVLSNN